VSRNVARAASPAIEIPIAQRFRKEGPEGRQSSSRGAQIRVSRIQPPVTSPPPPSLFASSPERAADSFTSDVTLIILDAMLLKKLYKFFIERELLVMLTLVLDIRDNLIKP
jgi:hypothetical protein